MLKKIQDIKTHFLICLAHSLLILFEIAAARADEKIIDVAAKLLKKGLSIGWMQGKMEFGPRSLGGRSILANPMLKDMQKQLNLKIV